MAYTKNAPYRADVVGSYLRPQELKDARKAFEAGTLDAAGLKAVEDAAITKLVAQQKQAGLHVITDGEFRRGWWHLDAMWGFAGVDKVALDHGYQFHGEETRAESARVTGKIAFDGTHPFVEHFRFLKQFEDDTVVARQTIPAPAQTVAEFYRPENVESLEAVYGKGAEADAAVDADVVAAYRGLIAALYDEGCRNVQLDDCVWGMLCDPDYGKAKLITPGEYADPKERFLAINNAVIADQPDDLVITTHDCRGNYHSTWASQGGYEPVADVLFARENVSAFYLEFDDDRSGDFAPLAKIHPNATVVLGLITSKSPVLEDPEVVKARIQEAAQYVPLDRLCLSTQCGFASTEEGNELTEEEQWAKIALVRQVATEVWGED